MSKPYKTREPLKSETRFVSQPLNLQKDVSRNPNVERKKREATDAAADIVSILQTLSAGQPPNNDQMEYMIERARRVLQVETKNPNLDSKARIFIENLIELFNATESIIVNKNGNQDFQNFTLYFIRSIRDLSLKGREGQLSPNVDRFKLESLFDDIKRVMLLVVRERQFRTTLVEMFGILERLFTAKTGGKMKEAGGEEKRSKPWKTATGSSTQSYKTGYGRSQRYTESDYERREQEDIMKDAREQLSQNIRNLLITLSENQEFQRGTTSMFSIIKYLQSDIGTSGFSADSLLTYNMIQAMKYFRRIVNLFVTSNSFDRLIDNSRDTLLFIRKDDTLRNYLISIQNFVERAMTDKEFLRSDKYNERSNYLIDEGRRLADEYYDLKFKTIYQDGKTTLEELRQDPEYMRFNNALRNLISTLYHVDSRGNYKLDTRTLFQMKEVLAPLIIEQLAFIPIPHISSRSRKLDWDVDGVVFSAYDILPDNIFVDTNFRSNIKPLTEYQKELIRDIVVSDRHHTAPAEVRRSEAAAKVDPHEFQQRVNGNIVITITNIKSYLKDVRFSFRRKVFPKMSDEGLANVSLGGRGCTVRIRIDMDNRNLEHSLFTGGSVKVKISKLRIQLRSTKRDGFYNFMTKVFSRAIARQIETAIAQRISQIMARIIEVMNRQIRKAPRRLNRLATSGSSLFSQISQQYTTSV